MPKIAKYTFLLNNYLTSRLSIKLQQLRQLGADISINKQISGTKQSPEISPHRGGPFCKGSSTSHNFSTNDTEKIAHMQKDKR